MALDLYKLEEKKYKLRKSQPHVDLEEVIDFSNLEKNASHLKDLITFDPVSGAYKIAGHEGFSFFPGALDENVQFKLAVHCLKRYCEPPHRTNLNALHPNGMFSKFWESASLSCQRDEEKYTSTNQPGRSNSLNSTKEKKKSLLDQLSWATLGYHYDWTARRYHAMTPTCANIPRSGTDKENGAVSNCKNTLKSKIDCSAASSCPNERSKGVMLHPGREEENEYLHNDPGDSSQAQISSTWSPFPPELAALAAYWARRAAGAGPAEAAAAADDDKRRDPGEGPPGRGPPLAPEAAIVNYYDGGRCMGGHRDDLEATFDHPVVSLSLGCPGVFLLGGATRAAARPAALLVRGGDVLVLGGAARLAVHGAPRVLAPAWGASGAPAARAGARAFLRRAAAAAAAGRRRRGPGGRPGPCSFGGAGGGGGRGGCSSSPPGGGRGGGAPPAEGGAAEFSSSGEVAAGDGLGQGGEERGAGRGGLVGQDGDKGSIQDQEMEEEVKKEDGNGRRGLKQKNKRSRAADLNSKCNSSRGLLIRQEVVLGDEITTHCCDASCAEGGTCYHHCDNDKETGQQQAQPDFFGASANEYCARCRSLYMQATSFLQLAGTGEIISSGEEMALSSSSAIPVLEQLPEAYNYLAYLNTHRININVRQVYPSCPPSLSKNEPLENAKNNSYYHPNIIGCCHNTPR